MEEGADTDGAQDYTPTSTPFTLILPVHPSIQCAVHKKPREIYCETHQAAICVTCAFNDHPQPTCKTVLLEEKTEEDRRALQDLLPDIQSTLKDLQDRYDRATAQQTDAEERYENEEQKIQAWREATTDELEEECERLVKELQDNLQQKIGEVNKLADSKGINLSTTWSTPLDTLQKAATATKNVLEDLDRHIALGAATADDSAATSMPQDAVEEVKQDLLDSVKRARDFLASTESDVAAAVSESEIDEQFGLGLKVVAEESSKDVSSQSTERGTDESVLQEELRACRERLQSYEEELSSHKTKVEQLQRDLSAARSTGTVEAKRLKEDNAFLTAELNLKTKDFEHANMRAEEMKADKLRMEQLVHDLRQRMKDLERKVESSRQPEASSSTPSPANYGGACQDMESPALLELRRIANSKSGWKKRVVRKDRVLKVTSDQVTVVNGPWSRATYDFLTGKTNINPGPVNYAPPAHDRTDYYCVNQDFVEELEKYFHVLEGQEGFWSDKCDYIPANLMHIAFKMGTSRQEALTSDDKKCDYIDVDDTFHEYCDERKDFRLLQVFVVGGSPLSPHKTIRHYLENTGVKLNDFTCLLFVGHDI